MWLLNRSDHMGRFDWIGLLSPWTQCTELILCGDLYMYLIVFLLVIVLSVLWFTASDFTFGIFKRYFGLLLLGYCTQNKINKYLVQFGSKQFSERNRTGFNNLIAGWNMSHIMGNLYFLWPLNIIIKQSVMNYGYDCCFVDKCLASCPFSFIFAVVL
jgi:hypothetical protein